MNNGILKSFINPFSDKFLPHWEIWKEFKKEEFGFVYRGVISEQMAIKHLVDLSDGDEEKAIKILCQSVRRKWQGFWPLKETTHGTRKKSTPRDNEQVRSEVQAELNKRFGSGGQASP